MIKMLKDTYFNGKQYQQGCEYPLDKSTENRWIKNKIAEPATKPCPEKPTVGPGKQPDK